MQVDAFLEASARLFPEKVALVCGDRRLTYREIDATANHLALGLQDLGVRRGDRVVIHLENSVEAVLSIFATLKAGGVFVAVSASTKAEKLAYILNDCQAAALITDGRWQQALSRTWEEAPRLPATVVVGRPDDRLRSQAPGRLAWFDTLATGDEPGRRPTVRGIDLDLAALVYTSGSTGVPKGVMLTHLNMVTAATSITSYLENTPHDVILNVLPLSFDYGLYQLLMAFKVGGRLVLERSFAYPAAILDTIEREQVTGLPVVPTIAVLLLRQDLAPDRFASLRYLTNTGAALPPSHIAELRGRLPHVRLYSMYGLSECKRVSYLPPEELDRRPGSVGRPMDNVEVFVVDEGGNRLTSGTGELVVRGSNVMLGYWGLPEETARALRPGILPGERLLYTGDIFRIDEEGFLYFLSRKDDVLKCGGQKVSPKEIENVIYELPGVIGTVVVGVPDSLLGQAVKAVVVADPKAGLTERDIARHCSQRLEGFMVPKVVQFVDSLPSTASGKLDRKELQAQAMENGSVHATLGTRTPTRDAT